MRMGYSGLPRTPARALSRMQTSASYTGWTAASRYTSMLSTHLISGDRISTSHSTSIGSSHTTCLLRNVTSVLSEVRQRTKNYKPCPCVSCSDMLRTLATTRASGSEGYLGLFSC